MYTIKELIQELTKIDPTGEMSVVLGFSENKTGCFYSVEMSMGTDNLSKEHCVVLGNDGLTELIKGHDPLWVRLTERANRKNGT